ncbi:ABC transporter permease [Planosporangium mesophilum]|uniref:ABC transporter substrate-binding protein n=1 Tax=Planosporangium mesophilum TaxID=689768 RepID=A0A8J3TBJ7_9ACTN|nr:FtsX-like permease family protein [Planosporangium mesophilum]NJC83078.1 FtsX-like permease family protein [Planosporangium mesophilum]GII22486.1 ABC transporter substrate-binding protein [Planosporangium mesophilum]
MLRATFKSLLSRKLRLLLSGLAVVLAVMFVSGAFILSDTLGRTFDSLFTNAYDYTDIQVQAKPKVDGGGDGGAVPANIQSTVVGKVAAVPGVAKATGTVAAEGARVVGRNGKVVGGAGGAPRFGINWTGEDQLISLREGRGPQASGEVALNAGLAKIGNFKVGEQVGVLTLEPKKTFTVVGIFGYAGGRDSIGGEQTVAFTEPVAQQLMLGATGVYNVIDVKVADKRDLTKVRDALRAEVGPSYQVDTGADLAKKQSDQIKKALSFVTYILLGFAAVALLVGVFLILNTFSIIVAQRTQELALLRAMGASRRQMIGSVLLEASLIGVVSWLVGLGLGVGIGSGGAFALAKLTGIDDVAGVGVPPAAWIVSFVVGVGVTILAALLPAFQASRVPPVAAMRQAGTADRPLTKLTAAGGVLAAGGGGALAFGLSGKAHDNTIWWVVGGVFVTFIAVALLTPLLGRPVVSVLGRLFAWSVAGKLGRRNSARNPRRTAITAAAMMISIALVTGISTIFTSVSSSVSKIVDQQVQADLIISGQQTSAIPPAIDPVALARVRALSTVDAVAGQAYGAAMIGGKSQFVAAFDDQAAAARILKLKPKIGRVDRLGAGEMVVDEATAKGRGWTIGDQVTIQLPRGEPRQLRVVGTYPSGPGAGGILLSWPDATAGFRTSTAVQAYVKLRPGAVTTAAKGEVDRILADSPEVNVATREEWLGNQTQIFDIVLTIVQVLLGVAMLIAVLGIVNTLVLSVLERTRELGMLRAIGLRRGQVMRMVTVESVVISLFGSLLGIAVGAGLGAAVVRALKDKGITELSLPWGLMVGYVVAGAFVGVVAAIIPAIRAARLDVLKAIAYE